MSCITRECNETARYSHKILGEEMPSCEDHYDKVWLLHRNAKLDIEVIIEELHWNCRNLDEDKEGGDEG